MSYIKKSSNILDAKPGLHNIKCNQKQRHTICCVVQALCSVICQITLRLNRALFQGKTSLNSNSALEAHISAEIALCLQEEI
nr:MAG TPA: hypothetical protein [Caudoviricetes sp.]